MTEILHFWLQIPSILKKTEPPAWQEETSWVSETLSNTSYNKILFMDISDSKLQIIRFFFYLFCYDYNF